MLAELAQRGLLLQQDRILPSVVARVTGESLHSSWWSHPRARVVFAVLEELSRHPDVLFTRLLHDKVTLVHRQLWPAFLAVALAGEPWQLRGLSSPARKLWSRVQQGEEPVRATGPAVKEIERRCLAHAVEVHTERGRHAMALESWERWRRSVRARSGKSPARGRRRLEQAAADLGATAAALPWSSRD